MKNLTKSEAKRKAAQMEVSVEALDLITKFTTKINNFIRIEVVKLQKRIRKQVKDELKGTK